MGPDNAWYIAKNPAAQFDDGKLYETYVVAIAGTATKYDSSVEDLSVDRVVDFLGWIQDIQKAPAPVDSGKVNDSAGTYIANGIAGAVYTLLHILYLPAPQERTRPSPNSFGGALAPTLALTLSKVGAFGKFDPSNVLVYPTAGPSPGNGNFASMVYQKRSIPTPEYLHIYGEQSYTLPLQAAVFLAGLRVDSSHIVYLSIQSSTFTGTLGSPDDFMATALEQHTVQYDNDIGIKLNLFSKRDADKQIRYDYPVLNAIVKAMEEKGGA